MTTKKDKPLTQAQIWRSNSGKSESVDNIYKYDYDTAILKYPSIASLLNRDEFLKFQAKYNN